MSVISNLFGGGSKPKPVAPPSAPTVQQAAPAQNTADSAAIAAASAGYAGSIKTSGMGAVDEGLAKKKTLGE